MKKMFKGSTQQIKYFKYDIGNTYKVGNTKESKGKTFHYCDTPNHCDRAKWHTHAATDYSVCKKWLRKQDKHGTAGPPAPEKKCKQC